MLGVSGPSFWHGPLDDGLWERKLPRAVRSPDTGWRLAAMNARTAPNIFVREGDGSSTLVVEGDWTAISIAGLSGHVLSPSNLSFSSDFGNLGRIDSAGALAILTLAPNEIGRAHGLNSSH